MEPTGRLVLLCHSGDWDRLYQAASAAAAAASMGQRVDLVFFFAALKRLVDGELDQVRTADPALQARLEAAVDEVGTRPVSQLLDVARRSEMARVYACSASTALMGIETETAAAVVEEIIGWPTVLRLMEGAGQVLYL